MSFFLRTPNSDKPSPILLKYYISKQEGRFTYSTGLNILPSEWSVETRSPISKRGRSDLSLIKRNLQKYSDLLERTIEKFDLNNILLTKENLKNVFDEELGKKRKEERFVYFSDFVEDFLVKAPETINRKTKKVYESSAIRNYNKGFNIYTKFEAKNGRKIRIDGFNASVYDSFLSFLQDRKYSYNSIGEIIKTLKTLISKAYERGYKIDEAGLKSFVVQSEKVKAVVFNEEEIQKILEYDFSENDRLQNARDLLIIGLWTGLRVNDFLSLPEIDLESEFIEVTPKKTENSTGVSVVIPLHHHIVEVIKTRGMPRKISDVKFNKYIKEVAEIVGFDQMVQGGVTKLIKIQGETNLVKRKVTGLYPKYELIASHVCRRSFATNLYKMNFPILSIMAITGHKTQSSFLKYIQITPSEHAENLKRFWKEYYSKKGK